MLTLVTTLKCVGLAVMGLLFWWGFFALLGWAGDKDLEDMKSRMAEDADRQVAWRG